MTYVDVRSLRRVSLMLTGCLAACTGSTTGADDGTTADPSTGVETDPTGVLSAGSTSAAPGTGGNTADPDTTLGDTSSDTRSDESGDVIEPTDCQGQVQGVRCEDTYTNVDFGWARVERWHDPNPEIVQMDFPPDGRGDVEGQRLVFFDNQPQPPSGSFLLYYAPSWDADADNPPVLLVHGANDTPDRAWANPNESGSYGCGDTVCPETGMMQALSDAGHRVFAIGFGHRQGDNLTAGQLIHHAVQIVRERTGAEQVDLIGWSMGAFSSRIYTSGVRPAWGQDYTDDVRKLILIGAPNHGFDYIFRYGINHNTLIYPECSEPLMVAPINAPSPHTTTTCYGLLYDHPELSIYATEQGDFYPGQKQMLSRWDDLYPIPMANQDWYSTYHGGMGFVSSSLGIDVAMSQGSLVEEILDAGVPDSVATYLLCGDSWNDPANAIPVIPNETSGPSDGVVFIDSCADQTGIRNVADSVLVEQNHLKLGWHPDAVSVVLDWLEA